MYKICYKRTCEFGKAFQVGYDPRLLEDWKIHFPMDATLLLLGGWTNPFALNMRMLNGIISPGFGVKRNTYLKRPPIGFKYHKHSTTSGMVMYGLFA